MSTHTRPFQPSHLYVQVRDELARRIARQEYAAGSLFPNEFMLAQEMRVSVGTIRKALEMLHDEKLVIRSQGRGTVVADRQSAEYRSKFDRVRNSDGTSVQWTLREIKREVRMCDDEEQRILQLEADQKIISIYRLREAEGHVVKTEYSRLPANVFGSVDGLQPNETAVENFSVLRGVTISSSDERLTVAIADEKQSQEFKITTGLPLLRLERIVYGAGNIPIEWRIAFCNLGDKQYHVPSPIGAKSVK